MKLRLVSYNIRFGGSGRRHFLVEVLRHIEPHIVIFQEATVPEVIKNLADELKMDYWDVRNGRSLAFISDIPPDNYSWHYTKSLKHPFLKVSIEEHSLRIFGVHLQARFSKWSERKRIREIWSLLYAIDAYRSAPHLLIGDFNTIAPTDVVKLEKLPLWIKAIIRLGGGEIYRGAIEVLLDNGYIDGFRWLYPKKDGFTLPTLNPNVRLDYVFLPSLLSENLKECKVVKEPDVASQASDHYPLLVVLEI